MHECSLLGLHRRARDRAVGAEHATIAWLRLQPLADRLVEMQLGEFSFILQDYYVREWADNLVVLVTVSGVRLWWDYIVSLDLPARYGVKIQPPKSQGWAVVAGTTDPSGVLWRFAELHA